MSCYTSATVWLYLGCSSDQFNCTAVKSDHQTMLANLLANDLNVVAKLFLSSNGANIVDNVLCRYEMVQALELAS